MMSRTACCFQLLLVLVPALLPAQKKTPGYFVTLKSDTVAGHFTGYRQWAYNPGTVSFVPAAGAPEQTLTPLNCRFFMVNGIDGYESGTVQRMMNPLLPNNADTTPAFKEVTAFLRVVFSNGRIRLLEYNDRIRVNYFLQLQNGQPQELIFRKLWVDNMYREDVSYRQQLADACAGEPGYQTNAAWQLLQRLPYNDREIAAFLRAVTGATHNTGEGKRLPARLMVLGGISLSTLKYTSQSNDPQNPDRDFGNYTSPLLGAGVTIYQQRNLGRNFFHFAVLGSRYSHSATYLLPASVNIRTNTVSATMLEVAFMPGRNLVQTPELTWYLAPGLSVPVRLNCKEKIVTGITTGTATQSAIFKKSTAINFTFAVQTGVQIKKHLALWLRYKHRSAADPDVAVDYRQSAVQAGAGYIF